MTRLSYTISSLLVLTIMLWCAVPCYGQEQYIAESFGLYSKGVDYYHQGKLHEAREILERAVKLDSRNDEALGYLDLVNSELRMRQKGQLGFYQGMISLRESQISEKKKGSMLK